MKRCAKCDLELYGVGSTTLRGTDTVICYERKDCEVRVLQRQVGELTKERDAYKQAKSENDERFMVERDEARTSCDDLRAGLSLLRSLLVRGTPVGIMVEVIDALQPPASAPLPCWPSWPDQKSPAPPPIPDETPSRRRGIPRGGTNKSRRKITK